MFYNPGGPGGPASKELVELYDAGRERLDSEIWARFDIIGVDLRGTGFSDPLDCNGTQGFANLYPDTDSAAAQLVASNRAFRRSCLELTGSPLFDYMDTASIARDHEAVRQALGGEKITWFGQSYGTQLGPRWAELYPEAFRAMLLDAISNVGQPPIAAYVEGGASVEATFRFFLEWCDQQNFTTCPLAHSNNTPEQQWSGLLEKATATSPSTVATLVQTAWEALYSPAWPASHGVGFQFLAESIYNASAGIESPKEATQPGADSRYNLSTSWAERIVTCADRWHPETSSVDWKYKKLIAQSEFPLMQGISATQLFALRCAGLSPPSRNPPHATDIPDYEGFPTICK